MEQSYAQNENWGQLHASMGILLRRGIDVDGSTKGQIEHAEELQILLVLFQAKVRKVSNSAVVASLDCGASLGLRMHGTWNEVCPEHTRWCEDIGMGFEMVYWVKKLVKGLGQTSAIISSTSPMTRLARSAL